MVEDILKHISELTPLWIYVALFFFSFIENVFPPSPSDLVVVIGGSLIAESSIQFIPTLIVTTVGSIIGFMTLFIIGGQLDKKVIRAGKIKFISIESIHKVEQLVYEIWLLHHFGKSLSSGNSFSNFILRWIK